MYVCSVEAIVTFLVWKVDLWPVWNDILMAKEQESDASHDIVTSAKHLSADFKKNGQI